MRGIAKIRRLELAGNEVSLCGVVGTEEEPQESNGVEWGWFEITLFMAVFVLAGFAISEGMKKR